MKKEMDYHKEDGKNGGNEHNERRSSSEWVGELGSSRNFALHTQFRETIIQTMCTCVIVD